MDDGRWTMDDGRWTMDDGRWTMDDGRWTMDDGRWTMDDISDIHLFVAIEQRKFVPYPLPSPEQKYNLFGLDKLSRSSDRGFFVTQCHTFIYFSQSKYINMNKFPHNLLLLSRDVTMEF